MLNAVVVQTNGGTQTIEEFFSSLITFIMPYAYYVGGFLIFIAVLMVGFDVIKHRNDADKRKESLHSLLWLAVGAFIIGSAVVIANMLGSVGLN